MRAFFYKSVNILLVLQICLWFIPETEIEGRVRLVGTAIFPSVVISTDDDKTFYFDESLFEEFQQYQNQTIKIKAKVKDKKMELADGSKEFIISTIYTAKIIPIVD